MNLQGNSLRNDLISLEDLAGLEAGGKRSPQYMSCLNAVCREFPSGDVRLVSWAEPHTGSLIANSDALTYWEAKYPKHPAHPRIAQPSTPEGWQQLVTALKADNDRLRGQAEGVNNEVLPVNATDDMRLCIETSSRYWTAASKDDSGSWNTVETITDWLVSKGGISKSRATAIQQVTRPSWASTGGRPRVEN